MGSVRAIGKRVAALEARRGSTPLDHLSEEQLAERLAAIDAELLAGIEAQGVAIPPDLAGLGTRERNDWIVAKVRELEL